MNDLDALAVSVGHAAIAANRAATFCDHVLEGASVDPSMDWAAFTHLVAAMRHAVRAADVKGLQWPQGNGAASELDELAEEIAKLALAARAQAQVLADLNRPRA